MRVPPKLRDRLRRSPLLSYPAALALRLHHAVGPRPSMLGRRDYEVYFERRAALDPAGVGAYRLARYTCMARLVARHGGRSVLDVAAGDGTTLDYLRRELPQLETLWASDLAEAAVEHCRRQGFRAFRLDLAALDAGELAARLGGRVDWILATEVLEHLPEPEAALVALAEVASRGVLVSVPNTGYYPFRLQLALGRFPRQWEFFPGEHLRYWTYRDFKWWLTQLGLDGRPSVYYGLPLVSRLWKNLFADGILWHVTRGRPA